MSRKPARTAVTCILLVWLGAVFQGGLAPHLQIWGAMPDFPLIFVSAASFFLSRQEGTILGFFAGLVQGAAVGSDIAHYAVSRAVVGFLGSWSRAIGLRVNLTVVASTAFLLTLVGRILYMFLAAPHGVASFLGDTIGAALYNGVLAIPVYMLLRRILDPRARSGL